MKQPRWKRSKVEMANHLRNNPTPAEARLQALLDERLNNTKDWPKFKFQRRALGYILDFYDGKHGLCIELDGKIHDEPEQREWDACRTLALQSHGVRVLRFPNGRIFNDTAAVMGEIEIAWRQGRETYLPKYRYPVRRKKRAMAKKKPKRSRWGKEARVMGLRRIP